MFLILGKPIIHDGRSFSHTVPVALKSDQVTSAKIKHGMVVKVGMICGMEDKLLYRDEVKLGMLVNFGSCPRVTIERFAL